MQCLLRALMWDGGAGAAAARTVSCARAHTFACVLLLELFAAILTSLAPFPCAWARIRGATFHATPGTLVEVVQCLTELSLSIHRARISSDGGWFINGGARASA